MPDPLPPAMSNDDPRIRFAAERTLLAWMRTGLALMGFGFVVARFGLFLHEIAVMGHATAPQHSTGWSVWIGTVLILLGVATSLAAAVEFFRYLRADRQGKAYTPRTASLAILLSILLAILGIFMAVHLVMTSVDLPAPTPVSPTVSVEQFRNQEFCMLEFAGPVLTNCFY